MSELVSSDMTWLLTAYFFSILVFLRVDNKSVTHALTKPREFLAVQKGFNKHQWSFAVK